MGDVPPDDDQQEDRAVPEAGEAGSAEPIATAAAAGERNWKPPSDIEQERWWREYQRLPEPRGVQRLARIVRASIHRVRQAVTRGWPELGIVAFRYRVITADAAGRAAVAKISEGAQAEALKAVAAVVVDTWETAARHQLAGLSKVGEGINRLAEQVAAAAASATFVTYRKVPVMNADGTQVMDAAGRPKTQMRPFVNGHQVAQTAAKLAQAQQVHADLSKQLLAVAAGDSNAPKILSGPPEMRLLMPDSDDLQDPSSMPPPASADDLSKHAG